jgi:hypothetical protein
MPGAGSAATAGEEAATPSPAATMATATMLLRIGRLPQRMRIGRD